MSEFGSQINDASPEFFFRVTDRLQMESCITALSQDSKSVVIFSHSSELLDYYGAAFVRRVKQKLTQSQVEIFMPRDTEAMLDRFNQLLNTLSLDVATASRAGTAPDKVWVVYDANALGAHELQLLTRLVQQFPGSGVSIVLMFSSEATQNDDVTRPNKQFVSWGLDLPTAEQKLSAIQQARKNGQEDLAVQFFAKLTKAASKIITQRDYTLPSLAPLQSNNPSKTRVVDDIRAESKPFEDRLRELVQKHVPKWQPWHAIMPKRAPQATKAWKAASQILVHGTVDATQFTPEERADAAKVVNEVRAWFSTLFGFSMGAGVNMGFRKNYFPRVWSRMKIMRDTPENFVQRVEEWAKTPVAQAWWREKYNGETLTRARANEFGLYLRNILASGAAPMEQAEDELQFMAPGFGYKNQRKIPQSLADALGSYLEEDVAQIMSQYMTAAIKRGVWIRRFSDPIPRDALMERMKEAAKMRWMMNRAARVPLSDAEVKKQIRADTDMLIERATAQNDGVNPLDPAAGLKRAIQVAFDKGDLSYDDYRFLNDEAIPSYLGQLGADFMIFGKPRPGFRHLAALMVVYQNLRVLSLGVLSQTSDFAVSLARLPSNDRWKLVKTAFAAATNGKTREEIRQLAMDLNRWDHQSVNHILNDEQGLQALGAGAQRLQEWFFRVNGMQWLTNWTRAIDLATGKDVLVDWAERGATRELKELGLDAQHVRDWVADGRPVQWGLGHDQVLSGLNQLVDEMVLIPDAATKPRWGNDARFGLIFHLKSFMYAFQLQVLDRAYNQSVARYGEEQGAAKFYAAAPYLALAAFTLPMAALAMELRWLIAPPKNGEPRGLDYIWEVISRSGMLGLASILTDMIETESHGKLSIVAPLGPAVSQGYDLGTREWWTSEGVSSPIARSLPAYPILQFLHDTAAKVVK